MKHLKYPPALRDKGITGTVKVSFLIEKDGSISEIVASSKHQLFCVAAVKAFRSAGKYPVVYYKGKPVKKWMHVPVRFSIR